MSAALFKTPKTYFRPSFVPTQTIVMCRQQRFELGQMSSYLQHKRFPVERLDKYGVEAQHPDEFIMHLLDRAVKRQRQNLKSPPRTVEELLETFKLQSLAQTVAFLRDYSDLL